MPSGYWRRAAPLEPFAPQLPVVELWEGCSPQGNHRQLVRSGDMFMAFDGEHCTGLSDVPCAGVWLVVKDYTNLCRTHVCKWEPTDANE